MNHLIGQSKFHDFQLIGTFPSNLETYSSISIEHGESVTTSLLRYKNLNCSCEFVENLLYKIAAVRSCAVYAVPHPDFINRVGQ